MYVESASFNGRELSELSLKHKEIVKGGVLKLVMSNLPNKKLK